MGERTDDLKGRIKEGVGAATDDRDLEREGKLDRAGASVKGKVNETVDAVKDAVTKDDRRS
jgi:uncharacterized protein YjbJ (UPF0337 family)